MKSLPLSLGIFLLLPLGCGLFGDEKKEKDGDDEKSDKDDDDDDDDDKDDDDDDDKDDDDDDDDQDESTPASKNDDDKDDEEPDSGAAIGSSLQGVYKSDDDVNCNSGGAVVVVTGSGLHVESGDTTCLRPAGVASAEEDGPFTLLKMSNGDSIRLKAKSGGLSISGEDAGYLTGNYTRDSSIKGVESWSSGPLTEIPAALQKEFTGCPNVNCTNGIVVTLTSSSFYTESTDSTCELSGKVSKFREQGPYTTLNISGKSVNIRPTVEGIRISGADAGYLIGDYHGPGSSCPEASMTGGAIEGVEEDWDLDEDWEANFDAELGDAMSAFEASMACLERCTDTWGDCLEDADWDDMERCGTDLESCTNRCD